MALRETNVTYRRAVRQITHSGTNAVCIPTSKTYAAVISKLNSVTYGTNIPGYREVIASGGSATTTLDGFRYTASASPAYYSKSMKPTSSLYASQGCSSRIISSGPNVNSLSWTKASKVTSPVAAEQAASALLRSYIDANSAWRGGNFLAEFAETVRSLRRPLDGIHRNTWDLIRKVTSMKRLFRRNPRAYARMLSGAWLSWSFGVRPLLSDVGGLEAAIRDMGNELGARDRLPIIGNGQDVQFAFVYGGYSTPYMDDAVHDSTLKTISHVRYKGACIATPPGSHPLLAHFGFTPEDIAPAVWEAIPWSFMIDYFVNVGEKIESLRWATADLAWLQCTVRNQTVRSWTAIRPPPPGSPQHVHYNYVARGGAAWTACTWVRRTPSIPPYPSWKFKIPNSLEQWINIAALAAGIRNSRPLPGSPRTPRIDIGDL